MKYIKTSKEIYGPVSPKSGPFNGMYYPTHKTGEHDGTTCAQHYAYFKSNVKAMPGMEDQAKDQQHVKGIQNNYSNVNDIATSKNYLVDITVIFNRSSVSRDCLLHSGFDFFHLYS